jgi:glycosyltransferase involved in cell wall biosynthesis
VYSIIIPHRNTSRLLERLLQSIPWGLSPQVIVVDNKSTGEELKAVEKLKNSYDFSLYTSDGCGAGDARNIGLQHALGEWVLFADSDDYFTADAEQLIASHANDTADIVFFNVTSTYSDTGERAYRDRSVKGLLKRYHQEHENTNVMRCLYTNPWGKMIRRSLITEHHIAFEDIVSGNDVYFSVAAGLAAQHVVVDERELYCVTVRHESITSTVDWEHIESNGQSRLRINRLLREHGFSRYQLSLLYYIGMSRTFGWRCLLHALCESCRHGNRPWVGVSKLLSPASWGGIHHNRSQKY